MHHRLQHRLALALRGAQAQSFPDFVGVKTDVSAFGAELPDNLSKFRRPGPVRMQRIDHDIQVFLPGDLPEASPYRARRFVPLQIHQNHLILAQGFRGGKHRAGVRTAA